jgi:hypothetical protein
MSTLVFDIETVGEDWSELDTITQKALVRFIDNSSHSESERQVLLRAVKEQLGFSPLTGKIVSVAAYDVEREWGAVYYVGSAEEADFTDDTFTYKIRTEQELLEDFWESARSYDVFVTFNGRQFDVPFMLLRSIACSVTPTVELLGKRYLTQQSLPYHVDLQDELTFYGALSRRPQLHLFCRAFGIESPKGVVSGDDVAELFRTERYSDIARYNATDVVATTKLYEKWLTHLAPRSWLNQII